jgi:hypothetical protein
MSREFDDVLAFLERFQGSEAEDREIVLGDDLKERLERFADGQCDEEERNQISEILRAEPGLVKWVADRVKAKRRK